MMPPFDFDDAAKVLGTIIGRALVDVMADPPADRQALADKLVSLPLGLPTGPLSHAVALALQAAADTLRTSPPTRPN